MNKQRTLLLLAGMLMAASTGLAQVEEKDPGEQVEHHLPPDQKLQQWSKDPQDLEG